MSSIASRLKTAADKSTAPGTVPHLIIIARAGTGKTTTLVEGLKIVKGLPTDGFTPSPQQAEIWDSMKLSAGVGTVCFAAFNTAIAKELEDRIPSGCEAMTMHRMGFKAVRKAFPTVRQPNSFKSEDILASLMGKTKAWDLKKERPEFVAAVSRLVDLCKANLVDGTPEELTDLISRYDIDTNQSLTDVVEYVPQVLEAAKNVQRWGCDFSDMIWLPIVLNLQLFKYDLLLVDEAQDLNRCQQELAQRAGKRLIFCGDDRQAIYGFAGADCRSMFTLEDQLRQTPQGVEMLPLTVTRRCGKAIVNEAKNYVPNFEAHESNGEGAIKYAAFDPDSPENYRTRVQDGDMVLCRCNAPLVSECFRFIRSGRKANIQGRDVGKTLVTTIRNVFKKEGKLNRCSKPESWAAMFQTIPVNDLISRITSWGESEASKENAKPRPSEPRLNAINDRVSCILCFTSGDVTNTQQVIDGIESLFTDDETDGIKLSSCHKSKGLEADNVFLLRIVEAPIPHPMAKTREAFDQEINLLYVAITRARKVLTYVTSPPKN